MKRIREKEREGERGEVGENAVVRGRDSEGGRERRNEGHGGIVWKGEREVLNCKCIPTDFQ